MEKTINIGGRLHNTAVGGSVAGADEIKDDTKGKMQNVINQETDAELVRLDEAKQEKLTFDQIPTEGSTNPVTSGGVHAADAALQQAIEAILLLIPSAASALNQLADKSFVNSSISTATATFRGTYNLVTDLELTVSATHQQIATTLASVVSTADNNDYCFVQIPVSDQSTDIRVTERYKFNGTSWSYEYDLNNSGFTADQWAAINSGITSVLVSKLGALPTAAELAVMFAGKQNTLTFDSTPVAGSDNPVKSSGLYNAFAVINAMIPEGADANNKLVAESRLVAYVTTLINALDATFDVTSADGHVTLRMTQADGVITSVQILTSDIASASALTTLAGRVSTAESDIDALQDAYAALTQSDVVIVNGALPSSGQLQNIIYRQPDQDHTPPQFYSDYMWNGMTWVLMATYMNAIDPRPKKGSQNLVTSGGVFDNMGALDVSELNATENPHTLATYADLSAALAAVPSDYQKGGMSIKFVQSVDNKYVQYRLISDTFTTTASEWQKQGAEVTISQNTSKGGVELHIGTDEYDIESQILLQFPFLKEIYINEEGINEGIDFINQVKPIQANLSYINFGHRDNLTLVARVNFNNRIGIFPITRTDGSGLLGYALIDGTEGVTYPETTINFDLTGKQYSLDYSPSIRGMINQANITQANLFIDKLNEQSKTVEGKIYERDNADKDMSNINSATTTTDFIWVEYPQTNKIKKVNRVRYRAFGGTTNFYVVTIDGDNATWDLIGSAINDVSEERLIKIFDFETITLNDNQYIGVNGSVFFSATSQGYKSSSIVVSTGIVNSPVDMCFALISENTNSIEGQIDEINNGINTTSIGHSVGLTINQYDTIITLANDNTGDYNDFHSAANAAINAVYGGDKVLLLIKDGIYNINAEQKGGSGYPILFDIKGVGEVVLQCLYNGANPALVESYAPLNIAYTTGHNTIRVENVTVIVDNVRYCVHDEMGSLNMPSYTHIFKKCKFIHKTSPNNVWDIPRCIGGGLGNKGLVIIDDCEFESKIETSVDYHSGYNGNAQSSKVIVKDCILANNTISATSIAYESEQSTMIVDSCILNAEPVYNDPENYKDIKLICKNNIII